MLVLFFFCRLQKLHFFQLPAEQNIQMCTFSSSQRQAEVTWILGPWPRPPHSRCPDKPVPHFKGMPLDNASHGSKLRGHWPVKAGKAGHYVKAAYRKGLHNESASKNLRLASVIDEHFIAACWSNAAVQWRRLQKEPRRFFGRFLSA